jgi:ribonucleoside-diphosphate reductase alpha chain
MLTNNAVALIKERYAYRGESVEDVFKRVAKCLSINDQQFEKELYNLMIEGVFLPNSPCIRNAGRKRGLLHACFILQVEDNVGSIFDAVKNMALIFKQGGGVGINYSPLRPRGAPLSSGGTSTGALSFMNIFNQVTDTIRQGGFRRGANMGILNYTHPEIYDFCRIKLRGKLANFNLSVLVDDEFMKAATQRKDKSFDLIHNNIKYGTARAKDILDLVALGSWACGDPALLFKDRINKDNKLYPQVVLDTVNPCSEVALPPYGACCLGSVNVSKFVEGNNFNFDKFYSVVKLAARALLHMNIISYYPLPQIRHVMQDLNPIGTGIMGFADALIMLSIKYDSDECLKFIDQLAKPYIQGTEEVAKDSFYKRIIAPTGSLSILADCSSGIEPVFSKSFYRHLSTGTIKETRDIYNSEYVREAHEVSPDWHLAVQAKWQSVIDGGLSKTINLPATASVEDVKKIYIKAWKMGVKGVTVFRDGSIEGVLEKAEVAPKCEDGVCYL